MRSLILGSLAAVKLGGREHRGSRISYWQGRDPTRCLQTTDAWNLKPRVAIIDNCRGRNLWRWNVRSTIYVSRKNKLWKGPTLPHLHMRTEARYLTRLLEVTKTRLDLLFHLSVSGAVSLNKLWRSISSGPSLSRETHLWHFRFDPDFRGPQAPAFRVPLGWNTTSEKQTVYCALRIAHKIVFTWNGAIHMGEMLYKIHRTRPKNALNFYAQRYSYSPKSFA